MYPMYAVWDYSTAILGVEYDFAKTCKSTRHNKIIVFTTLMGLVLNILLSLILMPG